MFFSYNKLHRYLSKVLNFFKIVFNIHIYIAKTKYSNLKRDGISVLEIILNILKKGNFYSNKAIILIFLQICRT